jgi:hypothetical protein
MPTAYDLNGNPINGAGPQIPAPGNTNTSGSWPEGAGLSPSDRVGQQIDSAIKITDEQKAKARANAKPALTEVQKAQQGESKAVLSHVRAQQARKAEEEELQRMKDEGPHGPSGEKSEEQTRLEITAQEQKVNDTIVKEQKAEMATYDATSVRDAAEQRETESREWAGFAAEQLQGMPEGQVMVDPNDPAHAYRRVGADVEPVQGQELVTRKRMEEGRALHDEMKDDAAITADVAASVPGFNSGRGNAAKNPDGSITGPHGNVTGGRRIPRPGNSSPKDFSAGFTAEPGGGVGFDGSLVGRENGPQIARQQQTPWPWENPDQHPGGGMMDPNADLGARTQYLSGARSINEPVGERTGARSQAAGSYDIASLSRQIQEQEAGGGPKAFDLRVKQQKKAMELYGQNARITGVGQDVVAAATGQVPGYPGQPGQPGQTGQSGQFVRVATDGAIPMESQQVPGQPGQPGVLVRPQLSNPNAPGGFAQGGGEGFQNLAQTMQNCCAMLTNINSGVGTLVGQGGIESTMPRQQGAGQPSGGISGAVADADKAAREKKEKEVEGINEDVEAAEKREKEAKEDVASKKGSVDAAEAIKESTDKEAEGKQGAANEALKVYEEAGKETEGARQDESKAVLSHVKSKKDREAAEKELQRARDEGPHGPSGEKSEEQTKREIAAQEQKVNDATIREQEAEAASFAATSAREAAEGREAKAKKTSDGAIADRDAANAAQPNASADVDTAKRAEVEAQENLAKAQKDADDIRKVQGEAQGELSAMGGSRKDRSRYLRGKGYSGDGKQVQGSYDIAGLTKKIKEQEDKTGKKALDLRVRRQQLAMQNYGPDAVIQGAGADVVSRAGGKPAERLARQQEYRSRAYEGGGQSRVKGGPGARRGLMSDMKDRQSRQQQGNSGVIMRAGAITQGTGPTQADLVSAPERRLEEADRKIEELEALYQRQRNLGENAPNRTQRSQYEAAGAQTLNQLETARQEQGRAAVDNFVYGQGTTDRENQAYYGTSRGQSQSGGAPLPAAAITPRGMNPFGNNAMTPGHGGMGNDPYATNMLTSPAPPAPSLVNLTPQPFVGEAFGGGADDGQYLPRGMGGVGGALGGDGGCCKRLTDILSQIRACVCSNEKPDDVTTGEGEKLENPHTDMLEKLKTSFDTLIEKLKNVIEELNPEEGDQSEVKTPVLTIDPASITNLSTAIKDAVSAKFDELIEQLKSGNREGGDASTIEGSIDLNHGALQVSGMVDVKMPEDLNNIRELIETEINKKLLKIGLDANVVGEQQSPATGGPMAFDNPGSA